MTYTPSPRSPGSANDDVQASIARGQEVPAGLDAKWLILDDLVCARDVYGIKDKTLAVLRGMLSWLQGDSPWMFAQNKKLTERCGGIPERTLTRHMGLLVEKGFAHRNLSPNGKRHPRKEGKKILYAFGYDLTPFFERAAEIRARAEELLASEAALTARSKLARDRLSRLRQALEDLGAEPALVKEISRERRRKPVPAVQEQLEAQARAALRALGGSPEEVLGALDTKKMAANNSHFGRHKQNPTYRNSSGGSRYSRTSAGERETKISLEERRASSPKLQTFQTSERRRSDRRGFEPPAKPCSSARMDAEPPALSPPRRTPPDVQNVLEMLTRKLQSGMRPPSRMCGDNSARPASENGLTAGNRAAEAAQVSSRSSAQLTTEPPVSEHRRSSQTVAEPENNHATGPSACLLPAGNEDPEASALPLAAVLEACPNALAFVPERPRSWSQLFDAAWQIGGWLNIGEALLAQACARLGREGLAVTILAVCERHEQIRQPAAYLRSLLAKPAFRPVDLLARQSKPTSALGW